MGSCDCSFRSDALDTIIAGINQLTFLVATGMVDATPFKGLGETKKQPFPSTFPQAQVVGVDANTTTSFRNSGSATQLTDVVHYKTHYVYAGIAFGITILCILLVVPAFWHYGQLGRDVTLNPMEVASAFRSPLLADDKETAEGRKDNIDALIKHIGDRKIQYGFVDVDQQSDSSAATEIPHQVSSPDTPIASPALAQGETSKLQKRKSVRLAMGTPEHVRPTSMVHPMSPRLGHVKE